MTTVPKETPDYAPPGWCTSDYCSVSRGPHKYTESCPRETETLQAWAERTALTLTDEHWRKIFEGDLIATLFVRSRAALLAVLDRIAGELSEQMRRELAGEEHGWPSGSTAKALRRRGLMTEQRKSSALDWRTEWRTPLGRAVLERSKSR